MSNPRWITPMEIPEGVAQITLDIPNRPEYRAILRGILIDLTMPANWQQIPGYSISPCDAAAFAAVILESFEETQ